MTRGVARRVRAGAPTVARVAFSMTGLALGGALLTGCGGSPAPLGPAGVDELLVPTPTPDPADFPGDTENAWFPLRPGTRWTYRQYTSSGSRVVVATVLPGLSHIDGVAVTAIRWQAREKARERTLLIRWYAVDSAGDVWWFGQRVSSGGASLDRLAPRSWRAGTHGAEAGLVLTATPRDGDGYANALQPRVVARRSTVLSVSGSLAVSSHTYHHVVVTRDLSSLTPLHSVQTFFGRGLGLIGQQDTIATSRSLVLLDVRRR